MCGKHLRDESTCGCALVAFDIETAGFKGVPFVGDNSLLSDRVWIMNKGRQMGKTATIAKQLGEMFKLTRYATDFK